MPIWRPAGAFPPNQSVLNVLPIDADEDSMKMTDSPGAMLVIPVIGTERPKEFELSSIRQPVGLIEAEPMFVTSNQSAARLLLLLDQGATSDMMIDPAGTACVMVRV